MITHICDRCGRPLCQGQSRYVARLEVYAAPDILEIAPEDLLDDVGVETDRLLAQCAGLSESELMRDVYVEMRFDLCRPCQQALLADPLSAALAGVHHP